MGDVPSHFTMVWLRSDLSRQVSSRLVRNEFVLKKRNKILEHEFAFLQTTQLQLIHERIVRQALDRRIQRPVFQAKLFELNSNGVLFIWSQFAQQENVLVHAVPQI